MPLTLQQERFVTEYLVDLNASRPHSGPTTRMRTPPPKSSQLWKNIEVQAGIATQQTQQL